MADMFSKPHKLGKDNSVLSCACEREFVVGWGGGGGVPCSIPDYQFCVTNAAVLVFTLTLRNISLLVVAAIDLLATP